MSRTPSPDVDRAPGSGADLAWVCLVASLLTCAMAWPVIVAPTERIFGVGIVGRHFDPFLVMSQMAGSGPAWPYVQPLTDWLGWLVARVLPPVTAFNLLVLSTFPLTAMATWLLARYLSWSRPAAWVAALATAFAPVHLAQAAYHPHIAQMHWWPVYLLALFAAIDRPSVRRCTGLVLAAAALTLSNFYGGLMAAVLTPVAALAYWAVGPARRRGVGHLVRPLASLAIPGGAVVAVLLSRAPEIFASPAFARPATDLVRYGARWWAFLTPPIEHVVFGDWSSRVFDAAGVPVAERLEQQVFVGWSLMVLATVGMVATIRGWQSAPATRAVVALVVIAFTAVVFAVGPGAGPCADGSWMPACRLYEVAPMFRAYARFGIAVQGAIALAAGAGVMWLGRRGRAGRSVAVVLVALAAIEYWPWPARARDVLPTSGHRLIARLPPGQQVLDCLPPRQSDAQVGWLMGQSIRFLGQDVETCSPPDLPPRLAALGYTHVLIRQPRGRPAVFGPDPEGLTLVLDAADALVYAVTAPVPAVVTVADEGFYAHEHDGDDWWRWMGADGRWTVRNTTAEAQTVRLETWVEAAGVSRTIDITLDGQPAGRFEVGTSIARAVAGPWTLAPGDHVVEFASREPPVSPGGETRALTIAFREVGWGLGTRD